MSMDVVSLMYSTAKHIFRMNRIPGTVLKLETKAWMVSGLGNRVPYRPKKGSRTCKNNIGTFLGIYFFRRYNITVILMF